MAMYVVLQKTIDDNGMVIALIDSASKKEAIQDAIDGSLLEVDSEDETVLHPGYHKPEAFEIYDGLVLHT